MMAASFPSNNTNNIPKVKSIRVRKRKFLENLRLKIESLNVENRKLTLVHQEHLIAKSLLRLSSSERYDEEDDTADSSCEVYDDNDSSFASSSSGSRLQCLYDVFDPNTTSFNEELDENMNLQSEEVQVLSVDRVALVPATVGAATAAGYSHYNNTTPVLQEVTDADKDLFKRLRNRLHAKRARLRKKLILKRFVKVEEMLLRQNALLRNEIEGKM